MATLSLKISIDDGRVVKTIQFDPSTSVYDACRVIRDKILEANLGEPKDYGLFLHSEEDTKVGVWLEPARSLEYYILRNGDIVEYKKKLRTLRVRMLDGSVKTLLVDDSQNVANLMVVICTKIGITNYDEYSLVRDDATKDELDHSMDGKGNYGTLTLRRRHQAQEKERDAKMDQLRKKLRTDDEVNWVDPAKTLREQGVEESETLLLRRKFFFSDRNVDGSDPVQLGLLYVQARDAIVDGMHPVTMDKACEFAGIQCQIQFGDHKEEKHTIGLLDLKEFLPASYAKVKGVEKKVFREHKKHQGLTELDAKVLYTKTARDLKTYGVAFFLVKEKMKGKNKLVPRLLGVTKDSVLRLDEKTKEILQTWPLTTVRRWCASPNTFTLDFGDYSDQYYSVQTTEAEQILQVIAGYIDIILKKQRAKEHFGIEGDEGSTMVEDSVSPLKATILQHDTPAKVGKVNTESLAKPAVMRAGADGVKPYSTGYMAGAQYTMISGQVNVGHTPPTASQVQQTKITTVTTEPQRALLSTISSGQEIIKRTEREITRAIIPDVGNDAASIKWKEVQLDTNKQVVTSHIAAMNAATAQVVTLTSGTTEEVDHTAVGAAITTITTNLPEMTKGVKMIAALLDDNDNGDKLLEATRKLCNAFSDLLKAAEPETKEPRQSLLNAASRVGEASTQVLYTISEDAEENKEIQDILLALAKAVANTTAALVLKAKGVAASCGADQQAQNRVIAAATQCALATSQLVACAKVVAPTLDNAACRKQISAAAAAVAKAVEALLAECCNTSSSGSAGDELRAAASDVSHALSDMLRHVDSQGNIEHQRAVRTIQETTTVETVMTATDDLVASEGDSTQMVKQARLLGQATAKLIQDIKTEAETRPLPEDAQRRLLRAARRLADATAKLVEAARACASAPEDIERRKYLRAAAIDVREAAEEYVRPRPAEPHAHLQQAARQAASAANQFATVANSASQHCTIRHVQETLYEETNALTLSVPPLLEAVKVSSARPSDVAAHLDLIDSSETFLQSGTRAAAGARAALAALDSAESRRLTPVAKDLASASSDLRSAVSQARAAYEDRSLEAAATTLRSLQRQLDDTAKDHSQGTLVPLPGETAETSSTSLSMSARSTGAGISRLLEGARRGDAAYAGTAARDVARHTRHLVDSVRGVAATAESHEDGERVIDSAQGLLTYSVALIEVTHRYFINSETAEISEVQSIAKNVTQSLNNTVNTLPSHRDVDTTIENINETLQILSMGEFPPTNKSYSELQLDLNNAAANLNTASTDVVTGVWSRKPLGDTAKNFGRAYEDLLTVTMEMAGQTKDDENRTQMVESMRGVSLVSSKLLSTARSVNHDPGQPDAKNKLSSAARAVTDSINYLVDVCTSAAPGQKECDNAIRSIQSAKPLLQNPSEPINNLSYFSCVDAIIEHSKTLGDGMSGMASHAKNSEHEQFGQSVRIVADSVCGLVECTAQAAYLVGVSDEHSVVGRAGTVDAAQFARASQAIQQACSGLADPNTNQHQVLSAATVIARHTSALCNACRSASAAAPAASAKRHFVQAAKDVANSTATLVKEIKALDADYSQANRSRCANATVPLLEAVQGLCQFANSPEFAAVPAKISAQGRRSQMPILESGRNIISGSCSMIESAKCLAVQPGDRTQWQNLAQHSRTLSDSIKSLVNNIRDKAPGQQECIHTIEILNSLLRQVDQTSLLAVSQSLQPRGDNTLEGYTEHLESAATEMLERLEPLRAAAKNEAENLGHTITQLATYANSLVSASEGAASLVVESRAQSSLLDCTKTVLEGSVQLVAAAKNAGGNPNATASHSDVDNECIGVRSALTELLNNCEEVSAQRGLVSGLVDNVTRAMERVTDHRMSLIGSYNESDSFVDYQTRMVGAAKEIARIATDMTAKSSSDPSRLTQLGGDAGHRYAQLAQDAVGAAATTANADIAQRIRSAVVELGASLVELVRAGGMCQLGRDERARNDVIETARHVTEKVGGVLAALQAGSKGTQACIDAVSTVSAIISDLDTTILFASAGTLHAEKDSDSFSDHREAILKTAKSLVEDTKTLVGGAAGSQEQLAEAARDAVKTIVQLSEVVKLGAMSLGSGNPDSQVMLIHAVRDVAAALRDLIQATKDASGKHIGDPAMTRLKDSAKVMVTNVTSLLKTVKAVEDEHTRGTRALEATIEAIAQEVKLLMSPGAPKLTATPEELVRCTKAITVATAKAVAAGNSSKQDDIIAVANIGRKAIGDMLAICKGAAHSCAETHELRERALRAGAETAHAYRDLLQAIHQGVSGGGQAAKAQYPELSRRVAQCAAEIVAVAETLRGSDWVDPDDPTVIAENELLGAAASIDAAANKLAALRPRKSVKEADENLNFDEMILEAAKSIIAATSALVRAASAAQRELIDQGIVARRPLTSSDDGQWSEGLISAARLVAAAAHSLVEAANALVQGCGSEERLVGCAKQVAGTTAQLLVACKVKADPNSETTRRLQAAGAAVIRSTDNLVSAARQAISLEEERCLVLNRRMVGGIAQEIDARSEVLRIERQLEEARGRLTAIRQAKYKLKTGDTSGDETDNEITLHSTGHSYNASPSPFSLNSTRQDGGYSSESPTRFAAGYLPSSTLNQSTDSPLKQSTRFNQSSESYNQSSSLKQMPSSFASSQTDPNFGQSSLRQTTSSFTNQSHHTQSNGVNSDYGQTMYIQQPKSPLSPPLPPPPPPILSSFSSFGRPSSTITTPNKPLNYEGFTTRIETSSRPKHDYETRSYDTPRPLGLENYRSENLNQYNSFKEDRISGTDGLTMPMSPRFNARFDLNNSTPYKTSFGPGTGQTFSQTQKSKENIPGGVRTSELTVKSESYQSQPFFSSEHRIESTGSSSTPRPSKIPTPTREIVARIAPPHSTPNYSEESSTEVRDVPNGTQKITTTKIYSSSPMQITTTKFQDPADDLKPSFLQPSDFRQTITGRTSSDLTKELDAMESRLAKQTVSSEVLEKKTVMTTSSKSEVSRTTTQKFGLSPY